EVTLKVVQGHASVAAAKQRSTLENRQCLRGIATAQAARLAPQREDGGFGDSRAGQKSRQIEIAFARRAMPSSEHVEAHLHGAQDTPIRVVGELAVEIPEISFA